MMAWNGFLEVEMSKECTPLWREAHVEVNMCKTPHARTTFGIQMSFRCGKSAGRCGAKMREAHFQVPTIDKAYIRPI